MITHPISPFQALDLQKLFVHGYFNLTDYLATQQRDLTVLLISYRVVSPTLLKRKAPFLKLPFFWGGVIRKKCISFFRRVYGNYIYVYHLKVLSKVKDSEEI